MNSDTKYSYNLMEKKCERLFSIENQWNDQRLFTTENQWRRNVRDF